jgi:hypothetical protein
LLGGDAPEANALIGKKHRGAGQKELAELEDRIEAPTLEKKNAPAEQAHGGKENVVITSQRWLEAPHEIEEGATNGQNNADDAGPVEAGVDQGGRRGRM